MLVPKCFATLPLTFNMCLFVVVLSQGTKSWRWYTMIGIAALVLSASVAAYRRFSHA